MKYRWFFMIRVAFLVVALILVIKGIRFLESEEAHNSLFFQFFAVPKVPSPRPLEELPPPVREVLEAEDKGHPARINSSREQQN
ncbi:MAG: hypothetical protein NZ480_07380 [Bdellovibrionaceae bacterium]|nr:hypothetical protein [Pseudobdellovibrionaceae bacterium]MDW8191183.1 hypothetical protein [Pseudobdellovibrionaceae bacterium]